MGIRDFLCPRRARAGVALATLCCVGSAAHAASGPLGLEGDSPLTTMAVALGGVTEAFAGVITALPATSSELVNTVAGIFAASGEVASVPLLLATMVTCLLCGAVPAIVRRLVPAGAERPPVARMLRLLSVDFLAILLLLISAAALVHWTIAGPTAANCLAVAAVDWAVRWQVAMAVVGLLLRPRDPSARLLVLGDEAARGAQAMWGVALAVGLGFYAFAPVLRSEGMAVPQLQGLALVAGSLAALFAVVAIRCGARGAWRLATWAGYALAMLFWLAWTEAVVAIDFALFHALTLTASLVVLCAVLERLLAYVGQQRDEKLVAGAHRPSLIGPIRRVVIVLAIAGLSAFLARLWLVDILMLVDEVAWSKRRHTAAIALAVPIAAYLTYEILRIWARRAVGQRLAGPAEHHAPGDYHPASRMMSVLPLLEVTVGIILLTAAVLVALSHLGIDISPLLAGAGIFGLAFSFGSQALVRDIVSGVFFIFDDAFRVGEYIVAGSHKGTVERLSIRSMRVRHQNGQIHTIPYGQLGAVTNFSRDWTTVKFNLRLARDTDIEKARKAAKQIGLELLDHPELGAEFIAPVKMQGVADVVENAVVCRFKFTVRPGKPTLVQREVLKRIFQVFAGAGIQFASNSVTVQGAGYAASEVAAARHSQLNTGL